MRRKKRGKNQPDFKSRMGSLSFYLSIPLIYALGIICLITLLKVFNQYLIEKELWVLYACALIGSTAIIAPSNARKLRTFIHELKHAIVVVLTGNRITDFHFDKHTGHVSYQMYKKKVRFAPFIGLAPYCYPMFSLPVFIACLVLENYYRLPLTIALGAALGADLTLGYQEIHSNQSDLKRVYGGIVAAIIFIAGFSFFWTMLCSLWVVGGRGIYQHVAYLIVQYGELAAQLLLEKI